MMAILHRNAETVEVVGLDEAYVDLTGLFSPKATMRRIAAEIREETGLTCSIGISESRLLAKITSELGKPAGLVVLSRDEALERFAEDPPGLVPGIGPKTVVKLQGMGIHSLADAACAGPGDAQRGFRAALGAWLHARGRFEDDTPLSVVRETKSQSAETTFDVDVADRAELEASLAELAEELCRRLRKRDLEGRTIGIKVRLDDWTNVTRSHTVERPTNDPAVVGPVALDLLRAYDPQRPVRLLGVRVASFESDAAAEAAEPRAAAPAQPRARPERCDPSLSGWRARADAREAEPVLGRLGEVVVAAGDVGAAVDHRHGDRCGRGSGASPWCRRAASCSPRPACPASGCRRRRRRCRRGRARSRRRRPGGRWSGARALLAEPRDAAVVDAEGPHRVVADPPAGDQRSAKVPLAPVAVPRHRRRGPRKTTLTRRRPPGRTRPRTTRPVAAEHGVAGEVQGDVGLDPLGCDGGAMLASPRPAQCRSTARWQPPPRAGGIASCITRFLCCLRG